MIDFNDALPQSQLLPSRNWIDQDELSDALVETAYSWVPTLFPQGRRDDEGHIRCGDITGRPPRKQGSCVIYCHGDHAGSWHDYDPAASPSGGGPLSTIKERLGLAGEELFAYCRQLIGELPRTRRAKPPPRDDTAEINMNLSSCGPMAGTPGEWYFRARKIPMPAMPASNIRFYADCTDWRTRRATPAIICRFTYPDRLTVDPDGVETREAIHRIYLEDDGHWHRGKKMLGSVDHGRVIVLGADDGSHTVGIGEGVETTAAGMAICRIAWGWAGASAGGMSKVAEWLAGHPQWTRENVARIVLFGDRGKAGTRGGNDIYDFAKAAGIAVEWLYPIGNDDLADDLFYERVGHALPFQLAGTSQLAYPSAERVQAELSMMPFGDLVYMRNVLLLLAQHELGERSNLRLADATKDAIFVTIKSGKGISRIETIRAEYNAQYDAARRTNQASLQQLADEDKLSDWRSLAMRNADNSIKPVLHNVKLAIKHDPNWRGSDGKLIIALNEFRGFPVVRGVLPWERSQIAELDREREAFRDWTDTDDLAATDWVQGPGRDVSAPSATVTGAIELLAAENKFHPVREFFDSLPDWDQIDRLEFLLVHYAGCEDTAINRVFGRKWPIGAVARVLHPGCKMDTALILEGLQGIGKSTFFRILAGDEFFTDQISDFGSKDSALEMQGKWIIELSELDAMNRSETTRIKSFLARQEDRFRPPYGRRLVTRPRQMVFCGTTNEQEYLRDVTGGRRFWPSKAGALRLDALAADRLQLWAEALYRYKHKEKWWLADEEEVKAATEQQSLRYQGDILEGQIANWLKGNLARDEITISEVLLHGLAITDKLKWEKPLQMRISAALRRLGYEACGRRLTETLYVRQNEIEQRENLRAAAITSPQHPEPPAQASIYEKDDKAGREPGEEG